MAREEDKLTNGGVPQSDLLPELTWETIAEAGTYLDLRTGDVIRVPWEALGPHHGLVIQQESKTPSRLVQVSRSSTLPTAEARRRGAQLAAAPTRAAAQAIPRYEEWSKEDLYSRAEELGVPGRSTMTKDELIEALRSRS